MNFHVLLFTYYVFIDIPHALVRYFFIIILFISNGCPRKNGPLSISPISPSIFIAQTLTFCEKIPRSIGAPDLRQYDFRQLLAKIQEVYWRMSWGYTGESQVEICQYWRKSSGHSPILAIGDSSNRYESMTYFSDIITGIYLFTYLSR